MERRTVIITGAGIGIGAATARAFAVADYRVVVTDVLEDDGQAVADEIRAAGGEAEFRHLDVTSTDEVDGVVAAVEKAHGPLEAL
ncbi:MAG: SDR family NAD(P)-dependent oxidoreductase, partial [Rubrobacteraceae bacterium]